MKKVLPPGANIAFENLDGGGLFLLKAGRLTENQLEHGLIRDDIKKPHVLSTAVGQKFSDFLPLLVRDKKLWSFFVSAVLGAF